MSTRAGIRTSCGRLASENFGVTSTRRRSQCLNAEQVPNTGSREADLSSILRKAAHGDIWTNNSELDVNISDGFISRTPVGNPFFSTSTCKQLRKYCGEYQNAMQAPNARRTTTHLWE